MTTSSNHPIQYTLYAFQAQATNFGAAGFKSSFVIPASDEELKDLIRSRMHNPDSEVVIIPAACWRPPAIASVDMPNLQRVFPEVLSKVVNYLTQCGLRVNPNTLIANGNVLPHPGLGRILFVYRVEGAPVQPKTMPASLQDQALGIQAGSAKKWWAFWKK